MRVPVELPQFPEAQGLEAEVQTFTNREAFIRGAKKSFRICLIVLLAALPFGFMEIFLFLVWGPTLAAFVTLFLGPLLHYKFAHHHQVFHQIHGSCPKCQGEGLVPFTSDAFPETGERAKALCPHCGETFSFVAKT